MEFHRDLRRHHVVSSNVIILPLTNANSTYSACLPTIRLLLVKVFPILAGSTNRSRQKYYNYGSGNELKDVTIKGGSRATRSHIKSGISSNARSPRSAVFPEHENGITVKTSYTVEHTHSDTDEASLVSHEMEKKSKP